MSKNASSEESNELCTCTFIMTETKNSFCRVEMNLLQNAISIDNGTDTYSIAFTAESSAETKPAYKFAQMKSLNHENFLHSQN